MNRAIAISALALLATACRRATPTAPTVSGNVTVVMQQSTPVGEYKVSSGGGQSITIGDIFVETTDDLPTRTGTSTTEVNGNNQVVVVLRGWQIVLHEGRLLVAGRDFGLAPSGSRVKLAKDGVHVGAELRGPLP